MLLSFCPNVKSFQCIGFSYETFPLRTPKGEICSKKNSIWGNKCFLPFPVLFLSLDLIVLVLGVLFGKGSWNVSEQERDGEEKHGPCRVGTTQLSASTGKINSPVREVITQRGLRGGSFTAGNCYNWMNEALFQGTKGWAAEITVLSVVMEFPW